MKKRRRPPGLKCQTVIKKRILPARIGRGQEVHHYEEVLQWPATKTPPLMRRAHRRRANAMARASRKKNRV